MLFHFFYLNFFKWCRLINDVNVTLAFIPSFVFLLASIFPQLNTKHNWLMSLCWFDLIDSSAWRRSSSVKIEQEVWIPSWFQPGSWLHFVVSENSFMRMIDAQISLHWSYLQQMPPEVTSVCYHRPKVWIIILLLTLLCLPASNVHFKTRI